MNIEDLEFTEEQKDYVRDGVEKMNEIIDSENLSEKEATLHMLVAIDRINEKNLPSIGVPSCRKGCAHCCYIKVAATENEARLVSDYCKENNIEITEDHKIRLELQARDQTDGEYMKAPYRRCVFLGEDNTCKIYPVRPSACRNYFVFSDPKGCNTFNPSNERVLTNFDIATLIPIITLFGRSKLDNFSKNLLKFI